MACVLDAPYTYPKLAEWLLLRAVQGTGPGKAGSLGLGPGSALLQLRRTVHVLFGSCA